MNFDCFIVLICPSIGLNFGLNFASEGNSRNATLRIPPVIKNESD